MLRLALLSLFVSSPAFAFYTTQFKVQVMRENIHDTGAQLIAREATLTVRYDNNLTCFVLTRHGDLPCVTDFNPPPYKGGFVISMQMPDFTKLLLDELSWVLPEFRGELISTLPAKGTVEFFAPATERNTYQPSYMRPEVEVKTEDQKTSYTIR